MNSPLKTYFWQMLKTAISMLTVIIYSRILGATGRGELSVYLLYLQMTLMATELFSGSAMANWFTQYASNRLMVWLISIPLVVLGLVFIGFGGLKNELNLGFPLFLQGMGLVLLNIQLNVFQSQGNIFKRNELQLLQELLKFFVLVIAIATVTLEITTIKINSKVILWILALATWLAALWGFRQKEIRKIHWFPILNPPSAIFFEGIWAQLGHVVLFLIYRAPIWAISNYVSMPKAGVFANVLLIADTCWIFANSFGTVIHSRVIRSNSSRFHHRLLRHYMGYSLYGTLILCLVLFAIPSGVYQFIFGFEFGDMRMLSIALIPAIISVSLTANLGNYLHAVNRFKVLFWNHFVGFLALIAFAYFGWVLERLNDLWMIESIDLAFFLILILHLKSVNWKISEWKQLVGNLLIIKRFIGLKF